MCCCGLVAVKSRAVDGRPVVRAPHHTNTLTYCPTTFTAHRGSGSSAVYHAAHAEAEENEQFRGREREREICGSKISDKFNL